MDIYSTNEDNIVDFQGNILPPKDQIIALISDLEYNESMVASMSVGAVKSDMIDEISYASPSYSNKYNPLSCNVDILDLNPTLDPSTLSNNFEERSIDRNFATSIGATDSYECLYLFEDNEITGTSLEDIHINLLLEDTMVSDVYYCPSTGIRAEILSKVWKIDPYTAKQTLYMTTQLNRRSNNPTFNQNYKTGDRMFTTSSI